MVSASGLNAASRLLRLLKVDGLLLAGEEREDCHSSAFGERLFDLTGPVKVFFVGEASDNPKSLHVSLIVPRILQLQLIGLTSSIV